MKRTSEPLFRTEALNALSDSAAQPLSIAPPASWSLSAFFLALCIAGIGELVLGTYTRRETVPGVIRPAAGMPQIASPRSGIVQRVTVVDGQSLRKGDVIAVAASDDVASNGVPVGREMERLQVLEAASRLQGYAASLAGLDAEARALDSQEADLRDAYQDLDSEVTHHRERLALASETLQRVAPLREAKLLAEVDYKRYVLAELDAREGLAKALRDRRKVSSEARAVRIQRTKLSADRLAVEAQRQSSSLEIKRNSISLAQSREFAIVAPADGTLTSTVIKPGDPVVAGAPIASVIPENTRLLAVLAVPSSAIGFVTPGTPVQLMFDAFPYTKFGYGRGMVKEVSGAPISEGGSGPQAAGISYRVTVEIQQNYVGAYGRRWPLTPGMSLSADVILEKRTFMEWLLDPVRAALGRV